MLAPTPDGGWTASQPQSARQPTEAPSEPLENSGMSKPGKYFEHSESNLTDTDQPETSSPPHIAGGYYGESTASESKYGSRGPSIDNDNNDDDDDGEADHDDTIPQEEFLVTDGMRSSSPNREERASDQASRVSESGGLVSDEDGEAVGGLILEQEQEFAQADEAQDNSRLKHGNSAFEEEPEDPNDSEYQPEGIANPQKHGRRKQPARTQAKGKQPLAAATRSTRKAPVSGNNASKKLKNGVNTPYYKAHDADHNNDKSTSSTRNLMDRVYERRAAQVAANDTVGGTPDSENRSRAAAKKIARVAKPSFYMEEILAEDSQEKSGLANAKEAMPSGSNITTDKEKSATKKQELPPPQTEPVDSIITDPYHIGHSPEPDATIQPLRQTKFSAPISNGHPTPNAIPKPKAQNNAATNKSKGHRAVTKPKASAQFRLEEPSIGVDIDAEEAVDQSLNKSKSKRQKLSQKMKIDDGPEQSSSGKPTTMATQATEGSRVPCKPPTKATKGANVPDPRPKNTGSPTMVGSASKALAASKRQLAPVEGKKPQIIHFDLRNGAVAPHERGDQRGLAEGRPSGANHMLFQNRTTQKEGSNFNSDGNSRADQDAESTEKLLSPYNLPLFRREHEDGPVEGREEGVEEEPQQNYVEVLNDVLMEEIKDEPETISVRKVLLPFRKRGHPQVTKTSGTTKAQEQPQGIPGANVSNKEVVDELDIEPVDLELHDQTRDLGTDKRDIRGGYIEEPKPIARKRQRTSKTKAHAPPSKKIKPFSASSQEYPVKTSEPEPVPQTSAPYLSGQASVRGKGSIAPYTSTLKRKESPEQRQDEAKPSALALVEISDEISSLTDSDPEVPTPCTQTINKDTSIPSNRVVQSDMTCGKTNEPMVDLQEQQRRAVAHHHDNSLSLAAVKPYQSQQPGFQKDQALDPSMKALSAATMPSTQGHPRYLPVNSSSSRLEATQSNHMPAKSVGAATKHKFHPQYNILEDVPSNQALHKQTRGYRGFQDDQIAHIAFEGMDHVSELDSGNKQSGRIPDPRDDVFSKQDGPERRDSSFVERLRQHSKPSDQRQGRHLHPRSHAFAEGLRREQRYCLGSVEQSQKHDIPGARNFDILQAPVQRMHPKSFVFAQELTEHEAHADAAHQIGSYLHKDQSRTDSTLAHVHRNLAVAIPDKIDTRLVQNRRRGEEYDSRRKEDQRVANEHDILQNSQHRWQAAVDAASNDVADTMHHITIVG